MTSTADLARRIEVLERQVATLIRLLPANTPVPEAANDDVREELWLETGHAADRLGQREGTVRTACRHKGIGEKREGRWWVNMRLARIYFRLAER